MTTRGLQPPPSESTRTVQGDHTFLARNLSSERVGGDGTRSHRHEVAAPEGDDSQLSVCLVGPGWRFTSGISYYTCRLANSMASDQCDTNVILLRRLLPRLLYPGKARVGLKRASMEYRADVSLFDGIDWWWGTSLLRALRFLRSRRPKVLLLEWWTVGHAAHLPAACHGRAPHGHARRHRTARAAGSRRGRPGDRPRLRPLGAARAHPARARLPSSTPSPTGSCSNRITGRWTCASPWSRTAPTTSTATCRKRPIRPSPPRFPRCAPPRSRTAR